VAGSLQRPYSGAGRVAATVAVAASAGRGRTGLLPRARRVSTSVGAGTPGPSATRLLRLEILNSIKTIGSGNVRGVKRP
jgi:hypothetical protein